MQRVARVEQQLPAVEAAARVEQLLLQVVELPRQQAAQLEVAVDHVVDHAQHQVGRAGRQRALRARASPPASLAAAAGCAKNSRTMQSVGCTVSSTRSKTAKPTGLVSIAAERVLRGRQRAAALVDEQRAAAAPAARRRNTSRSYHEV